MGSLESKPCASPGCASKIYKNETHCETCRRREDVARGGKPHEWEWDDERQRSRCANCDAESKGGPKDAGDWPSCGLEGAQREPEGSERIEKIKERLEAVRALGELHVAPSESYPEGFDVLGDGAVIHAEGCARSTAEALAHYEADVDHLLGEIAGAARATRLGVAGKVEALHRALCVRLGSAHPITFEAETLLHELRWAGGARAAVAERLPAEADLDRVHDALDDTCAQPGDRAPVRLAPGAEVAGG